MAKKKTTVIEDAKTRRDAILKPKWRKPDPLTAKQRDVILALITEGATLSEIFTIRGIASYGAFYATRVDDDVFDALVRTALAQGAEAGIAEASEFSRIASATGNPDDMRIAESFHRCAVSYAEKAAPKEFGQLVKLGNHDGGPLNVSVVNFALPALEGKFQRISADTRARELEDAQREHSSS